MPVDRELVTRKTRLILEDLDRLRGLAEKDLNAYLADPVHEIVAERLLERVIGRMIDINYHLCVELGRLPPSDYHHSFIRIAELGVLEASLAASLAKSSGMRNRLAHEYNGIDPRLVHAAARQAIDDVTKYLRAVEHHLGS